MQLGCCSSLEDIEKYARWGSSSSNARSARSSQKPTMPPSARSGQLSRRAAVPVLTFNAHPGRHEGGWARSRPGKRLHNHKYCEPLNGCTPWGRTCRVFGSGAHAMPDGFPALAT